MGMFDTIYFEQPIACAACQAPISSTQTKSFERLMDDFRIGDCIGHAEEIRLVREGLYCEACQAIDEQWVYLAIYRGILIDITLDRPAAEAQLRSFSFERLILWYHDLYAKRMAEQRQRQQIEHFLHDVVRWYEEGYDQLSPEERSKQRFVVWMHRPLLENAADPLAAIRTYLDQQRAESETPSGGAFTG